MTNKNNTCVLCSGAMIKGKTTFTAELGFGIVVVRNVDAMVCDQCGANWIDEREAEKIEAIVDEARKKQLTVEITSLVA